MAAAIVLVTLPHGSCLSAECSAEREEKAPMVLRPLPNPNTRADRRHAQKFIIVDSDQEGCIKIDVQDHSSTDPLSGRKPIMRVIAQAHLPSPDQDKSTMMSERLPY